MKKAPRKSVGRPKKAKTSLSVKRSISLPPYVHKALVALGEGSLSLGVVRAFEAGLRPRTPHR